MSRFTVRRTNFVDGMLLIAEDLSLEQSYFDRRLRQLAARAGWGVVEGLDIAVDKPNLVISPGYALDPQGHGIVLEERFELGVREEGMLCIRRAEPKELTASDIARMAGTSNDGVVVRKVEQAEVKIRKWSGPQDFECGWVPLAWITGDPAISSTPVQRLTVISQVSWAHGKSGKPADCWIEFSAPVTAVPADALEVLVRSTEGTETIVAATIEPDAGTRFHIKVDPGPRPKNAQRQGRTMFIRLACDFVLDWKGDPVSGAHLRGRLPSGNGVPGGVFESWFTISEQTP